MAKTPTPKKTNIGKEYEKPLKIPVPFDDLLKLAANYSAKSTIKKKKS